MAANWFYRLTPDQIRLGKTNVRELVSRHIFEHVVSLILPLAGTELGQYRTSYLVFKIYENKIMLAKI